MTTVFKQSDEPILPDQERWFSECLAEARKVAGQWKEACHFTPPAETTPVVAGFLHVYAVNDWQEILREMVGHAGNAGLKTIYAVVCGPEALSAATLAILEAFPAVQVLRRTPDATAGEFATLEQLYKWCRENPGGRVWYAHLKGVSRPRYANLEAVAAWRRMLCYWLFDRQAEMQAALAGHGVAGVELYAKTEIESALARRTSGRGTEPAYDQFSGNFWWATADYVATLPPPTWSSDRYKAEAWVLSNGVAQAACLWRSGKVWHYHTPPIDYQRWPYEKQIADAGSGEHTSCGGTWTGGIRAWQDPAELAALFAFLPRFESVLEIGVAGGGLARLLYEAKPFGRYCGIDLGVHQDCKLQQENLEAVKASRELYLGDSHDWRAWRWAMDRGPFDLVIVDGDHSFQGAEDDLHLAVEAVAIGGIVAFHDSKWSPEVRELCNSVDAGRYPWLKPVWRMERNLGWAVYRRVPWQPAVTVVIPDYDRFSRLAAVLEGLRQQECELFETIIVQDGGPWHATAEIVRLFRRHLPIRFRYLDPPTGAFRLAQSRNLGASIASGQRLLFLDNDCVPATNVVGGHAAYKDKPVVVAGWRRFVHRWFADQISAHNWHEIVQHVWKNDDRWSYSRVSAHTPASEGHAAHHADGLACLVWGCQFSVAAEQYRQIGGHHEDFVGWGYEDNDLAYRLLVSGASLVARPDLIVHHLDHAPAGRHNARANESLSKLARHDPRRITAHGRFLG